MLRVLSKRQKGFRAQLARVRSADCHRDSVDAHGNATNYVVGEGYLRYEAKAHAQWHLWFESEQDTGTRVDGFLLAHVKRLGTARVFYIDVVCSRHRKGKALIRGAEALARKLGCRVVALRAATQGVVAYYLRLGYRCVANACTSRRDLPPGAHAVTCVGARARDLDEAAYKVEGTTITAHGGWWMSKCMR